MKAKIIAFGLVFVFLLSVTIGMASALSNSGGGDWKYYKEISIKENSDKKLTDFQVLVELNPSNFPTNAKSDGSDLRFEDASGKELNYWIDDWDYSAKEAKIWVKVPSIPANGETKIEMYYGNPSAGAVSNGDTVFEFFDDFDSGKLDKWVIRSGDWSIENGELAGRGTKSKRDTITTVREFPVDRVVEVDVKHITLGLHSHSGIILGNTNPSDGSNGGNDCIRILFFDRGDYMRLDICGYGLEEQHKAPIEAQTGIWNHIKYQRLGKNVETNYKVWVKGEQKFDVSETLDTSTWKYFGLWVYLDGYAHFDNVRIRKYTTTEPTLTLSPEFPTTKPTPTITPTPAPPRPPEGKTKAVWLYNPDKYDTATLMTDLESTGINTIFLSTDVNNIWKYERFVKSAHENAIEVHAMILEDPRCALKENHASSIKAVETVLDYNDKSLAKFDGINIDTEPYVDLDLEQVWQDYITLLEAIHEKTAGKTVLSADIPSWYDESKIKDLAPNVDFFVIMAYDSGGAGWNTASEIEDAVASEMGAIRGEGSDAVIGIGAHEGFRDKDAVEKCVDELYKYYSADSAFSGVSIFKYGSYSGLTGVPEIPTGEEKGIPGFEAIFAIAGLLGVAYIFRRRK